MQGVADDYPAAAIDVLGASDPRFKLDPEERWQASMKGVLPEYSAFLRHGIGEVLILLALFGDRARNGRSKIIIPMMGVVVLAVMALLPMSAEDQSIREIYPAARRARRAS